MASNCSICDHRKRKAIDRALASGASLRDVAGQFGVSKSAVERHRNAHVAPVAGPVAAARAAEVAAAETEVRAAMVDAGRSTVEQVQALGTVALKCLARVTGKLNKPDPDEPDENFDARGAAALMGQVRGALELQAKLLGELAPQRVELSGKDGAPLTAPAEVQAAWAGYLAGEPVATALVDDYLECGVVDPSEAVLRRLARAAETTSRLDEGDKARALALARSLVASLEAETVQAFPAHDD